MNNRLTALAASLLAAAVPLFAQDTPARPYDPLFRVIRATRDAQVQRPTLETFETAITKMYPLGTRLRVGAGAEIMIGYINNYEFTLTGPGELLVAAGQGNAKLHLVLSHGKLRTSLVKTAVEEGDVVIEAPGFTCVPGPEATMTIDAVRESGMVASTLNFDRAITRVFGPQFNIPVLRNGCGLRIQAVLDRSLTRITGLLGEFPVQVDSKTDVPTEFTMKPNAIIKIARQFAPVTGHESVAVLIVNETGVGHSSYSFVSGQPAFFTEGFLRKPKKGSDEASGDDADETASALTQPLQQAAETVEDDGISFEPSFY